MAIARKLTTVKILIVWCMRRCYGQLLETRFWACCLEFYHPVDAPKFCQTGWQNSAVLPTILPPVFIIRSYSTQYPISIYLSVRTSGAYIN
ncbi:uncharacterized protein EDB91DRAFT_494301 [Suillus paluster]|uniref:uncharacterized protein n=1 Tax=Suillus paluster TaxID=48578 RepID=UPI001B86C65E|nr:uncharacterized protein EDB91DRAFT_494301 [Suillus paluster]KAG1736849.1 hypothetical protein EDB91DRAFT_494301 [Suillus paluster]